MALSHPGWRQAELDIWGYRLSEENPKQLYQPIRLQGQHYDHESGLHYNRYRYYNPNTGRYITQDPIGLLGGPNFYSYPTNPLQWVDPLGLQVCYVAFPDMPIQTDTFIGETTWLGGHAGVLVYNDQGITRYYEYGRYNRNANGLIGYKGNNGNIRKLSMPNLVMDKNGKPTDSSMQALTEELAKKAGKGTKVVLTCYDNYDHKKTEQYMLDLANNSDRPNYNWKPGFSNHCRSVAKDAVKAGKP